MFIRTFLLAFIKRVKIELEFMVELNLELVLEYGFEFEVDFSWNKQKSR